MAQEIADSKLLDTWGSGGTKIEPDISKIIEGWQLGEQPPHEYMNWLQNTFGSKLNHILKNGIVEWNNETEYLAGSSVKHSGSIWLCETTNTNSEPTDLNANWEKVAINKDLTVTVDTLADVRSISYPANIVWASGYHAKNDGAFGSHIFRLKGIKTTETDNGGTVIIAPIGGTDYVYELQYDGAVNVKWFGAKGDYSFSTLLGTDDSTTINNMFTYVNNIYFPPGNYLIENTINVPSNIVLFGDAQRKVTFIAKGCDAFKVYGNDTTIRDIKVNMDDGYWAFTYRDVSGTLAAGLTSTNCQNLNNQVYNGNAFNLEGFSRGLISGFIGNNLDRGVRITGYSHNSMISDSIFNGHNSPINNVNGEYAFKADSSAAYMNVEGLSVTNSKFISFYDGVINEGMRYSTFSNIIFDVITYQGYRNTGFNKNIIFSDCYFASNWEASRGVYPTAYGYKSFILFIPLSSEEANLAQEFKGCYFVTYDTAPDIIANIDLYNGGITFTLCHDVMSGSSYSICLVKNNKNCIITNNKQFKSVVSNDSYSVTPEFKFDTSNKIDTLVNTSYKNLSTWKELLYNSYTTTTASGMLKSNIMQVTTADGSIPKVFKVYVREGGPGLSFIDTKEYLVTMSYAANASVNNGIQLVATSSLWNGSINRVTPTLTSTAANTDKQLTFVWSSDTIVEIIIERVI